MLDFIRLMDQKHTSKKFFMKIDSRYHWPPIPLHLNFIFLTGIMPLLKRDVIKYLAVKDMVIFTLLRMSKLYMTSHHIFFLFIRI